MGVQLSVDLAEALLEEVPSVWRPVLDATGGSDKLAKDAEPPRKAE